MRKRTKKTKMTKYEIMAAVFAKKYAEKHNWRGYPLVLRFLDK